MHLLVDHIGHQSAEGVLENERWMYTALVWRCAALAARDARERPGMKKRSRLSVVMSQCALN